MIIDLHTHTTYSDGVLSPTELVHLAHQAGVEMLAVTDHDTVLGLSEAALMAEEKGVRFIPGIEISTSWNGKTIHIVGLNINIHSSELLAGLATLQEKRIQRARQIGEKCAKMGIGGAYEAALNYAGAAGSITRPHFARFLVEKGYAKTMQQAFTRYLKKGRPASVNMEWVSIATAVSWIHGAGGVAVIAHPCRYEMNLKRLVTLIEEFKVVGGDAIEAATFNMRREEITQIGMFCKRYGLLASVGSDFHGPGISVAKLGYIPALPHGVETVWSRWPLLRDN